MNSLGRLSSIGLANLSLIQIERMRDKTRLAMENLHNEIESDAVLLIKSLNDGDPFAVRAAKRLVAKHQTKAEYLTSLDETLSDLYQKRFMEDGMADRLGGQRVLKIFEALILALIVVVLGLLMYDLTAGPESQSQPSCLTQLHVRQS